MSQIMHDIIDSIFMNIRILTIAWQHRTDSSACWAAGETKEEG